LHASGVVNDRNSLQYIRYFLGNIYDFLTIIKPEKILNSNEHARKHTRETEKERRENKDNSVEW
jgi:hypothetical protein